jgi:hypothetical protein
VVYELPWNGLGDGKILDLSTSRHAAARIMWIANTTTERPDTRVILEPSAAGATPSWSSQMSGCGWPSQLCLNMGGFPHTRSIFLSLQNLKQALGRHRSRGRSRIAFWSGLATPYSDAIWGALADRHGGSFSTQNKWLADLA